MVEGYPNLKEEVDGSNPGCEISSLLDEKLARWSTASCAWRWPIALLSQKKILNEEERTVKNEWLWQTLDIGNMVGPIYLLQKLTVLSIKEIKPPKFVQSS